MLLFVYAHQNEDLPMQNLTDKQAILLLLGVLTLWAFAETIVNYLV